MLWRAEYTYKRNLIKSVLIEIGTKVLFFNLAHYPIYPTYNC